MGSIFLVIFYIFIWANHDLGVIKVFFKKNPQVGVLARILSIKLAINGDCPGGLVDPFWNPA